MIRRNRLTSRRSFNRRVTQLLTQVLENTCDVGESHLPSTNIQPLLEPTPVILSSTFTNTDNCFSSSDTEHENYSDSDSETEHISPRVLLRDWALRYQITHSALNDLLKLLILIGIRDLPLDSRTLLQTPTNIHIHKVASGEYWHAGITESVSEHLLKTNNNNTEVDLTFNIDGLPISNSSKGQFWPILCQIDVEEPIVIGVYYGSSKPDSIESFLRLFVNDLKTVLEFGIEFNNRRVFCKVKAFICDAPARAFVKGIVGHNAKYSCEKCLIEGEWSYETNHTTYNYSNCTLRTDANFRERLQEEHHKYVSPIEELPIDIIQIFALDPMHLVFLGVQKRVLKFWMVSKNFMVKLSAKDISDITFSLKRADQSRPKELHRTIRGLDVFNFWKATEFRTFLLKVGPVVLYGKLSSIAYNHFLMLHCAITICSSSHFFKILKIAEKLLDEFVKLFAEIYGSGSVTYNVHSLSHLVADVRYFGEIDTFSAFPFESKLGKIKSYIRGGNKPLQQVARRIVELSLNPFNKENSKYPVLKKKSDQTHIIPECNGVFNEVVLKSACLNTSINNRWVLTKTLKVLKIYSISQIENDIVLYASQLKNLSDLYEKPIKSSVLYIFTSDLIELPPTIFKLSEILCKMFYINNDTVNHTFVPILHTIDTF